MAKVAFLGLGVMGYPMAGHLKTKGGHELTVYNRTAAKAEKWVAQVRRQARADAQGGGRGPGFRHVLRRQRQRPARGDARARTAPSPAWRRARCSSTTPPPRPRSRASSHAAGQEARLRFRRRAGLRRPGRRRERRAHGDVRRRCRALCARRAGDRRLCAHVQAARARRAPASSPRWSTRSASPGWCRGWPKASTSPRRPASTSRR